MARSRSELDELLASLEEEEEERQSDSPGAAVRVPPPHEIDPPGKAFERKTAKTSAPWGGEWALGKPHGWGAGAEEMDGQTDRGEADSDAKHRLRYFVCARLRGGGREVLADGGIVSADPGASRKRERS
jgi:hypothetical protein